MSILDRGALEASSLADLHAIASELSIDGYRRLRKADVIDAILSRQGAESGRPGGDAEEAREETTAVAEDPVPERTETGGARRRGRRGGRGRGTGRSAEGGDDARPDHGAQDTADGPEGSDRDVEPVQRDIVEGVVELLPGGSGFVRVNPPEPSDHDVYISSAQVKRCELVSGDRVSGPRRAARRSERFASLVRVDTVNGRPPAEASEGTRFDDLPAAFPDSRLALPGEDPALESIQRVVAIGRGSRVVIAGPPCSGKTQTLRRLAGALAQDDTLQLWVVLSGVRPEELAEWRGAPVDPAVALSFAASPDTQSQALDGVVEQVRRLVSRGSHAAILIDTLDGIAPSVARKALASARNIVGGGSLTVIAVARMPLGGETGVLTLERSPSEQAGVPAIDPAQSWTIRPELLG